MIKLLVLAGIFYLPEITLGLVLIHYNHPVLGIIAGLHGIAKLYFSNNDEEID